MRRKWFSAKVQTFPFRAKPCAQDMVLPLAPAHTALAWARTAMASPSKHHQQELPSLSSCWDSATQLAEEQRFVLEGDWIWTGVNCVFRTSHGLGMLRKVSRKNIHVHMCFLASQWDVCFSQFPVSKRSQILFSPFFPSLPASGILEYFARPQVCLQLVVAVQ